jgi:23S rRNA pseudouridine1911/1915/1917 synthase
VALNRGYAYRAQIGTDTAGRALVDWLAATYTHSSTDVWRLRIGRGEVAVDDVTATAERPLRAGQVVVWQRPPWDEPEVPLTFDLIHADAHVLAVAKPSGLPTIPAGGFLEHTLVALVRARFGEAHPVHRLGRFTSGLVVFGRTHAAVAGLAQAWRARQVVKRYRALVSGNPGWTSATITTPIGPVPHPRLASVHGASPSGRVAHSVATVIERRGADTLCDVDITTGRPHQIRIHLASAGHPLSGDPLYAPGGGLRAGSRALPGDGGYLLHAHRLRLAHPIGGGPLELEAAPPEALRSAGESSPVS